MSNCVGELSKREVVNICDGHRYGFVCDIEVDVCSGRVCAIIVPGEGGSFFSRPDDIRIPWEKIEKIGEEIILVNMPPLCPPPCRKKRGLFF